MTTSRSTPSGRLGPGAWLRSFPHATRLLLCRQVRLRPDRVGERLTMSDGQTYVPFRHTVALSGAGRPVTPTVLQPRFRLRGVGRAGSRRHRLFWRCCIITTPFFVGLDGFRSKLWMYDPATGDYAGLYDWDDPISARAYADGLSAVLRLVSVPGSVSYELVPNQDVAGYLAAPSLASPHAKTAAG